MKEISLSDAAVLTSPNPLVLVCTLKEDKTTNLAPISFVAYASMMPPMLSVAIGKPKYTGILLRAAQKAIIVVPGSSLEKTIIDCGAVSGADINKIAEFGIPMKNIEGTDIQIPVDSKIAYMCSLKQTIDSQGTHMIHLCEIDKILADDEKDALHAWHGFAEVAVATKKK